MIGANEGPSARRALAPSLFGLLGMTIIIGLAYGATGSERELGTATIGSQREPEIQPASPPETPMQGNENTLVLPQVRGPQLAPEPPVLEAPTLPSAFAGCWEGDPGGFDWVATDSGVAAVGRPGKITFCYMDRDIIVPEAEVRIEPGARVLDWVLHLGLGFRTFTAHGISTDIFAVTPTRIRGRTTLVIEHTDHWLYVVPIKGGDPSEVDWLAKVVGPNTLLVTAEQVISASGLRMWGEWHANFHRVNR